MNNYSVHHTENPLTYPAVVNGDWDLIYVWLTSTKMRSRDENLPYVVWDDTNEYYISADKFINMPAVRDDPIKVFFAVDVVSKKDLLNQRPIVSGDEKTILAWFEDVLPENYKEYYVHVAADKMFYPTHVFLEGKALKTKDVDRPHRVVCGAQTQDLIKGSNHTHVCYSSPFPFAHGNGVPEHKCSCGATWINLIRHNQE